MGPTYMDWEKALQFNSLRETSSTLGPNNPTEDESEAPKHHRVYDGTVEMKATLRV